MGYEVHALAEVIESVTDTLVCDEFVVLRYWSVCHDVRLGDGEGMYGRAWSSHGG